MHALGFSNHEARLIISGQRVKIDGRIISKNEILDERSEVRVDEREVRKATEYYYYRFHKPRGFESTFSEKVEANLRQFFPSIQDPVIAGRLDKDSEGLLLVSNNGKWAENLCRPEAFKEKEYEVELEKDPDPAFLLAFETGVEIGGVLTRKCVCRVIGERTIKVVLTEGRNRQIRRMCRRLGNEVLRLKRTRIDIHLLGDLLPGMYSLVN